MRTVTGIFKNREATSRVIDKLVDAGIMRNDISLIMSDQTKSQAFDGIEVKTKAPEGAAAGAVAGGTLGAIAAGLAAVGSLAIPGVGLLAAGPIVAALAGAGAGAALGGLTGALIGLGIPEHEAKRVSTEIDRGSIVVTVYARDLATSDMVERILENEGARDVRETNSDTGYIPKGTENITHPVL